MCTHQERSPNIVDIFCHDTPGNDTDCSYRHSLHIRPKTCTASLPLVKMSGREADQSPPRGAEMKDASCLTMQNDNFTSALKEKYDRENTECCDVTAE